MTHVFVAKRSSGRSGLSLLAATFVVSALLTGCGGGHGAKPSTGNVQATSSSSQPATSPASTATSITPAAAASYWPYNKLVARLEGRTLSFPKGPVRLDGTLLECAGHGPSRKIGAMRRWSRYTCTQTLFRGGVDRDVTFEVAILNATQLRISSERYGAD